MLSATQKTGFSIPDSSGFATTRDQVYRCELLLAMLGAVADALLYPPSKRTIFFYLLSFQFFFRGLVRPAFTERRDSVPVVELANMAIMLSAAVAAAGSGFGLDMRILSLASVARLIAVNTFPYSLGYCPAHGITPVMINIDKMIPAMTAV